MKVVYHIAMVTTIATTVLTLWQNIIDIVSHCPNLRIDPFMMIHTSKHIPALWYLVRRHNTERLALFVCCCFARSCSERNRFTKIGCTRRNSELRQRRRFCLNVVWSGGLVLRIKALNNPLVE